MKKINCEQSNGLENSKPRHVLEAQVFFFLRLPLTWVCMNIMGQDSISEMGLALNEFLVLSPNVINFSTLLSYHSVVWIIGKIRKVAAWRTLQT